ncbi:MAG: hypothetical protein R3352_11155 [Salinisphaeraceae bacterium]|nr:hypothetical protein [Salinisphaeraceae bacterium]
MKPRGHVLCLVSLALISLCPLPAQAHGFGALYNLPVPLWLYNWSAAATLVVSFLIVALVVTTPPTSMGSSKDIAQSMPGRLLRKGMPVLRLFSLFLLFLCIATGLWGNPDPMRNFSPVFFWVIFTLVLTYAVAVFGDIYAALNPFRTLTVWIARFWAKGVTGRYSFPQSWGHWPALLLYLGFIGFELFGTGTPSSIAWFLLGYTVLNIFGVWLIGARDWFRYCEFFAVFFRLVALMAPVDYRRATSDEPWRLRLRWPLAGLMHERPSHISTVVFVLAMLATTAFDGLKATKWWVELFWGDPTGWLEHTIGVPPAQALATVMPWYLAWSLFCLVALPFLYLAVYLLVLWFARKITGLERSLHALAMDFAYSLLPIALMYHITHYWTLILTHGLKIFSAVSDPFGWQWNLFGTAFKFRAPIIPDMAVVWHSQVILIVLGHIASVWVAHKIALRVFPSRTSGMLSQVPMLALMIGFTVFGLWILAQPLTVQLLR